MELRHIRYFLMVAEERNFTRAAKRLGIGQPPLSMQIKDLERDVGTPLFIRGANQIKLTAAGEAFLKGVHNLPELANSAKVSALNAHMGLTGTLTLGLTGTAGLNPLLPAIVRRFKHSYPDVEIKVVEDNSLSLLNYLSRRSLDIAFLRSSDNFPKDVTSEMLISEKLSLALPKSHPLANVNKPIDLKLTQRDTFILTPSEVATSLRKKALEACELAGFSPTYIQPAPHIVSILTMVSAELGISLVPESMSTLSFNGVIFKNIAPPVPSIGLDVAWNMSLLTPVAQNLLNVARLASTVSHTDL